MESSLGHIKALGEKSLIEACLGGDQDAWSELVARYSRLVLAIPRHYGFPDDDAHDVFQDVFAALVDQLPRLRDKASLAKWLITTTHRTAWRHMQQRGRTTSLDGLAVVPDDAPPPPETALRWERQHAVRQAVRRLGGRCEQLLTALYLEEPPPSYDELSRRLKIPRGSIGPTRTRCLAKLLTALRASRLDEP